MKRVLSLSAIYRSVIFAYGLIVVLLVSGLVLATTHLRRLNEQHSESLVSIRTVLDLELALGDYQRVENQYLVKPDPSLRAQRDALQPRVERALAEAERHVGSPEEAATIERLRATIGHYFDKSRGVGAPAPREMDERFAELAGEFDYALHAVRELIALNEQQSNQSVDEAREWDAMADRLGVLFVVAFGTTSLALGRVVRKSFYQPLRSADEIIMRHGGSLQAQLPEEGVVEIRSVARAYNQSIAELKQARHRQMEFLAGVAHDLRNPLTTMRVSVQLLQRQGAAAEGAARLFEALLKQIDRMDSMLHDLSDATHIEGGRLQLRREPVDIVGLVHDCVSLFAASSGHQFVENVPSTKVVISCDPVRISQVLNNLLSNALKYSPVGSVVWVDLEPAADTVTIAVKDQGIGIPRDESESIFTPFQRSRRSRDLVPGVGLGLSVSRKIVEAHGGRIAAEPNPEVGSRVWFTLPRAPAAA